MAVNKVIYDGQALVDLTADTVSAETLLSGVTAHDGSGQPVTGTLVDRGFPSVIQPGDTPVVCCWDAAYATNANALANTGLSLTIPRAGTYRIKWAVTGSGSNNISISTRLLKNGSAAGAAVATTTDSYVTKELVCAAGDVLTLQLKGTNIRLYTAGSVSGFCACIDWDTGF